MKVNEFKVGALTLAAAVLLACMISFLGAFTFFDNGYNLHVAYHGVSGLARGNVVRYAGVPVGTVSKMEVKPDKVMVTLHINDDIKIPGGAEFSIGSDGVMGEKYVDVIPPAKVSGVYLQPDSYLTGTRGSGLDQFMENSSKVLEKVEGIADALNNVFGDVRVQKSMRDGFINARDISNNLNTFTEVMAETATANKKLIGETVRELHDMSVSLNSTAAHLDSLVKGADNQGKTGPKVAELAESLAATGKNIEKITGVLAEVAEDPQTKKDIEETLHNARSVSRKADKVLSVFDGVKMKPRADVMHSLAGGDWRGNMGVEFYKPEKNAFLYAGGAGVGQDSKLDLYGGRRYNNTEISAGAMQGDFGIGCAYGNKNYRLYTQLYDFNDCKLRLGGEFKLRKKLYLTGESLDVLHGTKDDVYIGVRSAF